MTADTGPEGWPPTCRERAPHFVAASTGARVERPVRGAKASGPGRAVKAASTDRAGCVRPSQGVMVRASLCPPFCGVALRLRDRDGHGGREVEVSEVRERGV